MARVNVVVVDATGNKEQRVGLPDDVKCGIIMIKLVEKIKLPSVGPDGNPISYKFIHKVTGRQLLETQTLAEAGIKDSDVLRLQPEITAGAGTSIKKKLVVITLSLFLAFSLCACDSWDYSKAMKAYEAGNYSEALVLFESLDDYKDSADMVTECRVNEIDELLQGNWYEDNVYGLSGLRSDYSFEDGRFCATLSLSGSNISNEGSYRINVDEQKVYVCYDQTYKLDENFNATKVTNTGEQVLFTYTYDGGVLALTATTTNGKLIKD